ncbi:MAG: alpha/beta hydrolase [Proteobacteria bacterium]|nr:alpha/beta hydrolase [Pseudomonadota bacterium]
MILLLASCMTLDPLLYNPEQLTQYGLPTDIVPSDRLEEIVFESEDGTVLYGAWAWQYQPRTHPTLVYFHGNASNIDGYMPHIEPLWELGYNVFLFDYRGYGRSEGTPEHDGVIADGRAAVETVLETAPWLEGSEELAYDGLSLGGFVGLHTALTHPPYALVTEDMFASANDLVELNFGLDTPPGWLFESGYDNVGAASQLDVPYLVMHGADDTYFPPDNARRVYDAANDPKRLVLVPGAGHADAPLDTPELYKEELTDWLEEFDPNGDTGLEEE